MISRILIALRLKREPLMMEGLAERTRAAEIARKRASLEASRHMVRDALANVTPVSGMDWIEEILGDWVPIDPDEVRKLAHRLDRKVSEFETERDRPGRVA